MSTEKSPLLQAEVTSPVTVAVNSVNADVNGNVPNASLPTSGGTERAQRRRHWKNILTICLAWLFNFTAVASFQNLQSSLNPQEGLGVLSIASLYAGSIISGFYAPLVVKALGPKRTILACMSCYGVYTACNFYPRFYTLIPAGTLMGLVSNPMWTAEGTYLATSAASYATLTGSTTEIIINRFNGIFYFFFQSAQISGNLIASMILYPDAKGMLPDANLSRYCGVHSCGAFVDPAGPPQRPGQNTLYILFSVYLGCNVIGALLILAFLDRLDASAALTQTGSACGKMAATFRLVVKDRRMLLFLPLMIYSGVQKGFIADDFTKAFVTCTQGIHYVGFVMMTYGVTDALCCLLLTRLQKHVGRVVLFTAGAGADLLVVSLMWFVWPPMHANLWALFLAAGVWGFGDSVWQTQIASLLGVTFTENLAPAYANFRLCQAVGNGVMFAVTTSDSVCVYHKIIGLSGLLGVSLVFYYILECMIRRTKDKPPDETVK
ncbi:protein unc-93 homolog A-like [Patiria miniata]|uniref:Uncharacterized protein n=1 Tax=Patiria miniata TaxID=46514 RepID=A0A914BPI9_PATMI|nr:protein unc-93 homolog A-like [Patiria miniata]